MDITVLGSGQDAGVPQMFCDCSNCLRASADADARRTASSVAVSVDDRTWLLDAAPDIRMQVVQAGIDALAGVALTHAHAGHVAGLAMLGKEGPEFDGPVLCTPSLARHVSSTWPALRLQRLGAGESYADGGFTLRFHHVAHRAEASDTVAIEATDGSRRLLYLPDTDRFDAHVEAATRGLGDGDVLLFDATFWSAREVKHRDVSKIPHPFVEESLKGLEAIGARGVRVVLTHLNHTNPLCDATSLQSGRVAAAGLEVARDGLSL